MADRSKPTRRLRWLVLAGLAGAAVWIVRTRRTGPAPLLRQWPAAEPGSGGGPAVGSVIADEPAAEAPVVERAPEQPVAVAAPAVVAEAPVTVDAPVTADAPVTEELPLIGEPVVVGEPAVTSGEPPAEELEPITPATVAAADEPPFANELRLPEPEAATPSPPASIPPPPPVAADPIPSTLAGEALFTPAHGNPTASDPGASASRPTPTPRRRDPAEQADTTKDFGPGSAEPLPDGSAPGPEFTIKGNADSKLFHRPSSPFFARTRAEVWFRTATDARAAGFTEAVARDRSAD